MHQLQIRPIVHNAQLGGTPYHSPTYSCVRAVVWECGEGQTHRRPWPMYISPRVHLTWNVKRQSECVQRKGM